MVMVVVVRPDTSAPMCTYFCSCARTVKALTVATYVYILLVTVATYVYILWFLCQNNKSTYCCHLFVHNLDAKKSRVPSQCQKVRGPLKLVQSPGSPQIAKQKLKLLHASSMQFQFGNLYLPARPGGMRGAFE